MGEHTCFAGPIIEDQCAICGRLPMTDHAPLTNEDAPEYVVKGSSERLGKAVHVGSWEQVGGDIRKWADEGLQVTIERARVAIR